VARRGDGGGKKDGDATVSGRRGFFRLGLKRMRERVVEAVHTVAEATAVEPERPEDIGAHQAHTGLWHEQDGRSFHRVRVRGTPAQQPPARPIIRPPGALAEAKFLEACTRCGDCADACPEASIFKAGPQHGAHVEMTPMLDVESRACYLCTGVPCAAACPSGALQPIQAEDINIGTAVVFESLCLNAINQPCSVCVDACPLPQQALILPQDSEGDPERRKDGSLPLPVVDADVCTGCGLCVLHCRAFPKALIVTPN